MRHRFNRLHFIGIGGSGMSGLAEVLLVNNFVVTGSDLTANEAARRLEALGAEIHIGHNPNWLENANAVVYSSAVRPDNIELAAARQRKIPVISRAEMLAELMRMKTGIAVSGTHGKTTTTSLIGEIFTAARLDPTVIVGGRLRRYKGGAVQGAGEILIAEADEFDRSFLRLTPTYVVINNIDADHIECYGGFAELENAFVQFGNSIPFYGRAAVCIDEPSLLPILPRLNRSVVAYGMMPQADVRGVSIVYKEYKTRFKVSVENNILGEVELNLPGRHNVLNALASIAISLEFNVPFEAIKTALQQFEGVHRRFEIIGEKNGVTVVDDFAHHPAEISATLAAAKTGWNRPVVAVFQPHLYSRTQALYAEFARALLSAETVIVLPIYASREDPVEGVSSRLICDAARDFGHKHIIALDDREQTVEIVRQVAQPNDFVIILGAGDVYRLAPMILDGL